MFCPDFKKFRARSREDRMKFTELFSELLRRRLYPNSCIRMDDLAFAIGAHGMTVRSWLRGENSPSGPMMWATVNFFTRLGDHAFLAELFPDAVTPLIQRKREDEEAAAVGYALKKFMQSGAVAA